MKNMKCIVRELNLKHTHTHTHTHTQNCHAQQIYFCSSLWENEAQTECGKWESLLKKYLFT